jgi:hypothetical protein
MQASEVIPTIKVKPWGKDQGEFVEINADDFDPAKHTEFDSVGPSAAEAPEPSDSKPRRKGIRKA